MICRKRFDPVPCSSCAGESMMKGIFVTDLYSKICNALAGILPDKLPFALNTISAELRFRRFEFGDDDISSYLQFASRRELQPLLRYVNDCFTAPSFQLIPQSNHEPRSPARLQWILSELGILEYAGRIKSLLPKVEADVLIDGEFRDWYTHEREVANSNYWRHYRRTLEDSGWNADAIETVNQQAREVLCRLEDPTAEAYRSTRGLVVGHVQSGKTANFTAVVAKAIDAGYRLVIILAGTLSNLRDQTQRRLDKELLGREAVLDGRSEEDAWDARVESYFSGDPDWDEDRFVRHGSDYGKPGFPVIKRLTTSTDDYQAKSSKFNPIDFQVPDPSLPVHHPENLEGIPCRVVVVKKHQQVLKKLNSDLKRVQAISDLPVLVIDDESDQASINTKDNRQKSSDEDYDRTAVNAQITAILQNCPRAQYIGYTATPFANVFIDPSDAEDLYPRHFVLLLNQPPAYRGARWFHDRLDFIDNPHEATIENSNSVAFIRDLEENEGLDNDELFTNQRDSELQEVLDMFVLTGAIKKYREAKDGSLSFKHHTLLVHEGLGTDVHSDAKSRLDELWRKRGYGLGRAIPSLERLFNEDLLPVMNLRRYNESMPVPETYEDLRPFITEAYEEICRDVTSDETPILQVDVRGGDTPNFEGGRVWKVLVGGQKLSRGYTVEGLTISYFRRRAGGADTLMQTGRWFGFRKGYQDLVRLYAPPSLVELFEAAMNDEEVFRSNARVYSELDNDQRPTVEPRELAPLVRQSRPDLPPTSRNKKFNAYLKKAAAAPRIVEFNSIPERENRAALKLNFEEVAVPLLSSLKPRAVSMAYVRREKISNLSCGTVDAYMGLIPAAMFVELLDKMKWYEGNSYKENIVAPRLNYLKDLLGRGRHANQGASDFADVAVILPVPKGKSRRLGHSVRLEKDSIEVPDVDFEIPLVKRSRRENRHDITGSDRKYSYAAETIAAGEDFTQPRSEDWDELSDEDKLKFAGVVNPLQWDPVNEKKRGAVLLTLFDDRDPDALKARSKDVITPPDPAKGEVGFALAFNSPHAPVLDSGEALEWGVFVGNGAITIDTSGGSESR